MTQIIQKKSCNNSRIVKSRFDLNHWIKEKSGPLVSQGDIESLDIKKMEVNSRKKEDQDHWILWIVDR
jgi:hypothetical protein